MLILYNAAAPWQGYIVTQVAANINQMDVGLKLDVKALSLYRIRQFLAHPDGVSLKGCSYIYAPAGQAGEYAPLAANPSSPIRPGIAQFSQRK